MKPKFVILLLLLCSCSVSYEKERQSLINELEREHDIVGVIKLYEEYSGYNDTERKQLLLTYLSDPDINMECVDENNQTDDCILYRRTIPKSHVNYFDYKRLLGQNSIIKTDAEFLHLVEYYEQIDKDCDSTPERTTTEKQDCKDQKIAILQRMVHERIKCSELVPQEYEDFIFKERDYYDDQLNQYKRCTKNKCDWYDVKGTFRGAKESVIKSGKWFSEKYMCSTDDWSSRVFK
ncbi:MAG: hypothetical protein J6W40_02705 [Alphaproteobacteria bacterium]|nr:hypothetical protein [Alphaproteobacteria bacterium]